MRIVLRGGDRDGDLLQVGENIEVLETVRPNILQAEAEDPFPAISLSHLKYHKTNERDTSGAVVFTLR